MARYPGADWRPLGPVRDEPALTRRNKVVLHTMVGSLDGTDAFFRSGGFSGVESHFGVGGDGTVYQWQSTWRQADAQLEGNDDCISIETADHGPEFPSWSGSDVPAWTRRQVSAIVDLLVWACRKHSIPARLIPDTEDSTRGIGYHRQGIDPFRKHGEHYSESFGKVCPGDRRVRQIRETIIPRVRDRLNGDDDMANADQVMAEVKALGELLERHHDELNEARANEFKRDMKDREEFAEWRKNSYRRERNLLRLARNQADRVGDTATAQELDAAVAELEAAIKEAHS